MNTIIIPREKVGIKENKDEMEKFKIKAIILDELLEFIEDRYFGYAMKLTEKESNIPFAKAKKLMQ